MDKQEMAIWKSDAQIIQENIDLYQENRRLKAELEEARREIEGLKGQIRGSIHGHMQYYEKRRARKDLISDISDAGRVMAGLLLLTVVSWNVFMIVWGLG